MTFSYFLSQCGAFLCLPLLLSQKLHAAIPIFDIWASAADALRRFRSNTKHAFHQLVLNIDGRFSYVYGYNYITQAFKKRVTYGFNSPNLRSRWYALMPMTTIEILCLIDERAGSRSTFGHFGRVNSHYTRCRGMDYSQIAAISRHFRSTTRKYADRHWLRHATWIYYATLPRENATIYTHHVPPHGRGSTARSHAPF